MPPTAPSPLTQSLRERGLQVTAQRVAVLQAAVDHPHGTADEIAAAVRAQLGSVSKQGVYDALAALVDTGLVRRIQPAGSPARYEHRVGDNHHHLICRTCRSVADIDCAAGAAPCLDPVGAGDFAVDEAEVIYWGTCAACRRPAPG